jgi:ribosomal protein S18 acetylase RimI-like enzyme
MQNNSPKSTRPNILNSHYIKYIVITLICVVGISLAFREYQAAQHPHIYPFNASRDTQPILNLFDQNWHWLVSSDDYSPEFTLKYLAPSRDPRYVGKLHISVLRQHNQLMGFVAYYMKKPDFGFLLFLAVDQKFRKNQYGETLLRYGLQQLADMGAKRIQLLTRLTNLPARRLYERVGFKEFSRNQPEGFIYFEYTP